jgi:hypothetical protein
MGSHHIVSREQYLKRIVSLIVLGLIIAIGFQNCGKFGVSSSDSSSYESSNISASAAVELFPFGKFETANDLVQFKQHFYIPSNSYPILSPEAAHSGANGLRLDDQHFQVIVQNLNPSKTYVISLWARRIKGDRETPTLYIKNGTGPGPAGAGDNFQMATYFVIQAPEWQKFEFELKPTGPTLYFEFWIHYGFGNAVDMDEFSVREK